MSHFCLAHLALERGQGWANTFWTWRSGPFPWVAGIGCFWPKKTEAGLWRLVLAFRRSCVNNPDNYQEKKTYKPTETINYISQSFLLFLKKEKSRLFRSNQEYFLFFFAMIEAFCILMDKCPLEKKVYILNFHYETNLYPIKAFGPGLWLMRCQTPLALCSLVGWCCQEEVKGDGGEIQRLGEWPIPRDCDHVSWSDSVSLLPPSHPFSWPYLGYGSLVSQVSCGSAFPEDGRHLTPRLPALTFGPGA